MWTRNITLAFLLGAVACAAEGENQDTEDDSAAMSAAPEIGPEPEGSATRYPILIAMGVGNTQTHWPMYGVASALRKDGHVVGESSLPVQSAEVRGEYLGKALTALRAQCGRVSTCDASKVNIIAYSMGGLDARAMIDQKEFGQHVASLSMVSAPNRGSSIADVILKGSKPVEEAFSWLTKKWMDTYDEPGFPEQDAMAAWRSLSVPRTREFNRAHPDHSDIFYQSWAGVSEPHAEESKSERAAALEACEGKMLGTAGRPDWLDQRLTMGHAILAGKHDEANDGMVTVRSAKWGEFRGCLPADHQDEIGRVADNKPDRRTGFNHVRLYRNMAFELAAKGF